MSNHDSNEGLPHPRRSFLKKAAGLAAALTLPVLSGHSTRLPVADPEKSRGSGILMPIGGGLVPPVLNDLFDKGDFPAIRRRIPQMTVDECDPYGIIRHMLSMIDEKRPPSGEWPVLEIITAGSGKPPQAAEMYQQLFARVGTPYNVLVNIMPANSRAAFDSPELADRMSRAGGVFMSGGDQSVLAASYNGTETYRRMVENYHNKPGFIIAGSSAGAMVMAGLEVHDKGTIRKLMIDGHPEAQRAQFGLKLADGMELMRCLVESHVGKRHREPYMVAAAKTYEPGVIIGLDDHSCLVLQGDEAKAFGAGRVLVTGNRLAIAGAGNQRVTAEEMKNFGCEKYADVPVYCFRHGQRFRMPALPAIAKNLGLERPADSLAGAIGR